jgi:hypothetical protein
MFILKGAGYAKYLLASFVFSYKRAECTLDTKAATSTHGAVSVNYFVNSTKWEGLFINTVTTIPTHESVERSQH